MARPCCRRTVTCILPRDTGAFFTLRKYPSSGAEIIKHFSMLNSALNMKLKMLIDIKIAKMDGIFRFNSAIFLLINVKDALIMKKVYNPGQDCVSSIGEHFRVMIASSYPLE